MLRTGDIHAAVQFPNDLQLPEGATSGVLPWCGLQICSAAIVVRTYVQSSEQQCTLCILCSATILSDLYIYTYPYTEILTHTLHARAWFAQVRSNYNTLQSEQHTQFLPTTAAFHPLPLHSLRLPSMWSCSISKGSANCFFFHPAQWFDRICIEEQLYVMPKG